MIWRAKLRLWRQRAVSRTLPKCQAKASPNGMRILDARWWASTHTLAHFLLWMLYKREPRLWLLVTHFLYIFISLFLSLTWFYFFYKIKGRCADSALVLGPLIYEFGWKANDYDLLSAGSLAGHIIECACQATGGNFTDWKKSLAGNLPPPTHPL